MLNPDSFGGKVLLSFVDKIILGILLAIIVGNWESERASTERKMLRVEQITSVHVQKPLFLLEELSRAVRDYLSFVESNKAIGINGRDEKMVLLKSRIAIETLIDLIQVYEDDKETEVAVEALKKILREFNVKITAGQAVLRDYREAVEKTRVGFIQLSELVVAKTVEEIKKGE